MNSGHDGTRRRDSTRLVVDPPTFSPTIEMRTEYLARRHEELTELHSLAKNGLWKQITKIANHVRGTGAMYGFTVLGEAAERLFQSVQNGHADTAESIQAYKQAVESTSVE